MKKLKDERILKETNKIAAPLYWLILALTVAIFTIKLFFDLPAAFYVLEVITFAVSLGFFVIRYLWRGILFNRVSDERILEYKQKTKAICFYICFFVIVFGEGILFLAYPEYTLFLSFYLLIIFMPGLIATTRLIKNGLFIPKGGNNHKKVSRRFALGVVVGSLLYGIIVEWDRLFVDGLFEPSGILAVLLIATFWGVPFYFLMKFSLKASEKHADKRLKEAEKETEDTENEE